MSTEVCFLGGEVLRPSVTPSWLETVRLGSQSWKFSHTSSHYFRFVGSDVPSSELGKSALEVFKVFSKLSNLKMKSKS